MIRGKAQEIHNQKEIRNNNQIKGYQVKKLKNSV